MAVKVVSMSFLEPAQLSDLRNEVLMLKHAAHPRAVNLRAYYESPGDRAWIVTDMMSGGEVFDRLVSKGGYTEGDALKVAGAVVELLAHIHAECIAHRDLKLENLMLRTPGDDSSLVVADFGLAAHSSNTDASETGCGTPHYVSPEMVLGKPPFHAAGDMRAVGARSQTFALPSRDA